MLFSLANRQTKCVYYFSLLMVLPGVLFSYFLSDIHAGHGWIKAENLGWLTVFQFAYLTFFMLLAWWSSPRVQNIRNIALLIAVAVVARIILLPIDSYTSNDVDRYLFDGKIALSGLDPYRVNHNDPQLKELKQAWSPPEEHAKYPTLYPPLSLGLFALVASAGVDHAFWVWKFVITLSAILTVLILALLLRKLQRLQHLPLIALSPLLILETGVGAHVDAITTFMVSLALYAFYSNRFLFSGFFIGLGVLTKILPIMLMLPLFFGVKKISHRLQLAAACLLTIFMGYLVTLLLGLIPIGSIATLFEKWRFGSPLFSLFESFADGQILLGIALGFIFLGCFILLYQSLNLDKTIEITNPILPWSIGIILLVSPVVFPWYLMLLVPLISLSPRPVMMTWICSLPLTYEVLGGFSSAGIWSPADWPLIIIAIGFLLSLYFELKHAKKPTTKPTTLRAHS